MALPLSHPHFCTLLLLVMSNFLLWEKAVSIPECLVKEDGCWDPVEETFNSAIQSAEIDRIVAEQVHTELYSNKFSSEQFAYLMVQLIRRHEPVYSAGNHCHSLLTNPPNTGITYINIEIEEYLKTLINYVGSWISPLYHLVIELSAMEGVPETLLLKVKEIEKNNRQILDDIRWILTKVYPTAEIKEEFPSWKYLSFLKSSDKKYKFIAMFNLSYCLEQDAKFFLFHLRILKCRITGKEC